MIEQYHLGLPMWAHKLWVGEFYAPKTPQNRLLAEYASVFNTVEGNTTFYANPKPETIHWWKNETNEQFKFCFKFPQVITHQRKLRHIREELLEFLKLLDPIQDRLGPFLIGLPSTFEPRAMDALDDFLKLLSKELPCAVEFRHPAFFKDAEETTNRFLEDRQVDRVLFHTDTLLNAETDDPEVMASQPTKPRVPHLCNREASVRSVCWAACRRGQSSPPRKLGRRRSQLDPRRPRALHLHPSRSL